MKLHNTGGHPGGQPAMRQVTRAVVAGALWLLAAGVSSGLAHAATQNVPVWLSSGVTFAALLCAARGQWLAPLAGVALASVIWDVSANGLGFQYAVMFALLEILSVSLGVWIASHGSSATRRLGGTGFQLGGMAVSAVVSATLRSAIWDWLGRVGDFSAMWHGALLSSFTGLLLVVPMVLAWCDFRPRRSGGLPMAQFVGGALAFGVFAMTAMAVFGGSAPERWGSVAATLAYLPMPFLLLACALWGRRGGTLAMLLGALLVIGHTARDTGPFAVSESFPGELLLEVQGFVIAWAVLLMVLHALSEGHRLAWRASRDQQLRHDRILGAVGAAGVEYDATSGDAIWTDGAAMVLNTNAPLAANVSAWFDVIDPSERQLASAAWEAVAKGRCAASEQTYTVRLPGAPVQIVRERLAAIHGREGRVDQVVALLTLAHTEPPDA